MWINNHTYNILIEEEAPVTYGGVHMAYHNDFDSSDSVSSTETYIEETILSTKSCEEGEKSGFGETFRPVGEEEGGKTVEDGVQSSHKKKNLFVESTSKIKTYQRRVLSPFMNGERVGQKKVVLGADLDFNPGQVGTFSHNSVVAHAELAKAVMDRECSSTVRELVMNPIQDRELVAHSHAGRVPSPTQNEAGNPGLGITQAERRREELNVSALCGCISGGKEEGAFEEDKVNDVGNSTPVQGTVPVTSTEQGPIPVTS